MLRLLLSILIVAVPAIAAAEDADQACTCDATPAACDDACACDSECEVDWSADECADPAADCEPDAGEPDDAMLEAEDMATPDDEPVEWATGDVRCPDGSVNTDDRCLPAAIESDVGGGCSSGRTAGIAIALAALGLVVLARRRRALLAMAIVASCAVDASGWDDAVEAGPRGDDSLLDVYAAELGDGEGMQLVLAHQALAAGARQPAALMSLSRAVTGYPVYRLAGDRLVTTGGDELLGWAHGGPGDGTAELVELQSPTGGFVYETHAEAIDAFVAAGYAITNRIGYVWPPGMADPIVEDEEPTGTIAAPAPCSVSIHSATRSPLVLLYASPGAEESLRFLKGCPGEVVIGEKREGGPVGRMRLLENKVAGGRTAFVLDRHGDKLRGLLLRTNGVERTRAYLKNKLAKGYDYIVIDEVTAAPDYRDGATLNRRLRRLMQRMPTRTIIPYISIDLLQQAGGFEAMRARRLLLRTFKLRARALALEIYLHTDEVMAGAAPLHFRRGADRLALAVSGLPRAGGINLRAISSPATSMHSTLAQYRYLDRPKHDLDAITRQVNAIRHGSRRLRQQNGVGYYFVNKSDMKPAANAPYSYDGLIRRMRRQALRFRGG